MPHSGMPGAPSGPASWSTSTESAVTGSAGSSIRRLEVVVVAKDDGRTRVLKQPALGGRVLDDRAIRREVTAQHGDAAFRANRSLALRDDLVVRDERARRDSVPSGWPLTVRQSTCSRSRSRSSTPRRPPA